MTPLPPRPRRLAALLAIPPIASLGALGPQNSLAAAPLRVDREATEVAATVSATLHQFEAVVRDYQAAVEIDPDTGSPTSARFAFEPEQLDTGKPRRDREMLEWLGGEEAPAIVFELAEVRSDGELAWVALGHLSLNGVREVVRLPFSLRREGREIRIEGAYLLDHRRWNLPVIRKFLLKVDPELEVRYSLQGTLPPPSP